MQGNGKLYLLQAGIKHSLDFAHLKLQRISVALYAALKLKVNNTYHFSHGTQLEGERLGLRP